MCSSEVPYYNCTWYWNEPFLVSVIWHGRFKGLLSCSRLRRTIRNNSIRAENFCAWQSLRSLFTAVGVIINLFNR
jgi:hypothetical protein